MPGPILVLDSRLAPARAGVWSGSAWLSLVEISGDPLDGLFLAAQNSMRQAGLELSHITAFVYNEGPGSALALRTTAITLSSWQQLRGVSETPLFSYNTMRLLAAQNAGTGSVAVIAAARQGLWHLCEQGTGLASPVQPSLVPTSALAGLKTSLRLVLPMSKHWEAPPDGWIQQVPDLDLLKSLPLHPGLIEPRPLPHLHEPPVSDYAAWSGKRHR